MGTKTRKKIFLIRQAAVIFLFFAVFTADAYYTTDGTDIVDRQTGEVIQLRGFGLGCWLLPEGYMYGAPGEVDRPNRLEPAIVDLIGEEDANEFWRLYHWNFVTEQDIKDMKRWGCNSVRISLLASVIQPRDGQPASPPYVYDEEGWRILDSTVAWCERWRIGIIWDMHGAPGAQSPGVIADGDGTARLWTEPDTYWPRLTDLWYKIADRYKDREVIIGYDLLNEPILGWDGHNTDMLREIYVILTDTIRTVDDDGIMFVEGDEYAGKFDVLEPIDWDPHLAVTWHIYPVSAWEGRADNITSLCEQYNCPQWWGETGEVGPPFTDNRNATEGCFERGIGWSWWTHKKFNRETQPFNCYKTNGFQALLDYWGGSGSRPSADQAREWLFEQARNTHSDSCGFLSEMVSSLYPLDPDAPDTLTPWFRDTAAPEITTQPADAQIQEGESASFSVGVTGYPLNYQWYKDGSEISGGNYGSLGLENVSPEDNGSQYSVRIWNDLGEVTSDTAVLTVNPFPGPFVEFKQTPPVTDGSYESMWQETDSLECSNVVLGEVSSQTDLSADFRTVWDNDNLYVIVGIVDETLVFGETERYQNDGIELFIDINNDKASSYGSDDFHYRFVYNSPEIEETGDGPVSGINFEQTDSENGYVMEIAIPWTTLSAEPQQGDFLGLDVQVNDNDGSGREGKLAWSATQDNAWQNPSVFGTVKLMQESASANRFSQNRPSLNMNGLSVFDGNGKVVVDFDVYGKYGLQLFDLKGKVVMCEKGRGHTAVLQTGSIAAGLHILKISRGETEVMRRIFIR